MKVLCVYPSKLEDELPLGLLSILTALKRQGHSLEFFSPKNRISYLLRSKSLFKNSVLQKILSFKPDMVCFTVHSNEYNFIIELSKMIKTHSHAKIVAGGPHVTFMADKLDYNVIDFACRGEGDQAIVELADCIENNTSPEKIPNIYGVYNGKFFGNPQRNLIEDLDILPFPDRSLIDPKHLRIHGTNVVSGRGCPFLCTYCVAKPMSNYYHGKGKYVRWRTKENIIEELLELKECYLIPKVAFSDQTFTLNKKWLLEFLDLYKSKINLPFVCQTRVDRVDREIFIAMKEAGCHLLYMGIESGNEDLRIKILKRNQSNEQILEAFRLAKEVGILTSAFNMVGIPGETINTIKDGISLNRLAKPDFVSCNIFMPFPGTFLYDLCKEKGYINSQLQGSYRYESVLSLPTITRYEVMAFATTFEFGVKISDRLYNLKPMIDRFVKVIFKIVGRKRYFSVPISILLRRLLRVTWKMVNKYSS